MQQRPESADMPWRRPGRSGRFLPFTSPPSSTGPAAPRRGALHTLLYVPQGSQCSCNNTDGTRLRPTCFRMPGVMHTHRGRLLRLSPSFSSVSSGFMSSRKIYFSIFSSYAMSIFQSAPGQGDFSRAPCSGYEETIQNPYPLLHRATSEIRHIALCSMHPPQDRPTC